MGSLDFDAPHLPLFLPLALNFSIVKQVVEGKEAEANEVIQRPFLHPRRFVAQMNLGNRNISIVVDDELPVRRHPDVKLDAVEVDDSMPEAIKRVFGGLDPRFNLLHAFASRPAFSRFASGRG